MFSAAGTPYLLDRVVSGVSYLTTGVFECDIAHRRSVAELCMTICSNPTYPINGELHVLYVQ